MGGGAVRYEPTNTTQVRRNPEVWKIFQNAGWDVYFERLQGFDADITAEFAQNLDGHSSMVRGLKIRVTEETIATASGLPISGQRWFVRKTPLPEFPELFLREGEEVKPKGKGYEWTSLCLHGLR
jgi:hypothetical protein